ncbi:FYN-binding protein 1 isoform X2 [Scleropages formosus]|uniref:FYN-binding protein 1 isoform X2 n=1 Tax=Scleropages formosus TaxID=113540 RepID=UPI000878E061|nr:FYN-binding protein 1-like isoform X2 [Scleropages formosus]
MEENVDFKTLRDRFHAKAEMADAKGGDSQRLPMPRFPRAVPPAGHSPSANGAARPKLSPAAPGPRSSPDLSWMARPSAVEPESTGPTRPSPPFGVFPRPPPSHRTAPVPQEPKTESPVKDRVPGKVKATGELLQNMMLKPSMQDSPLFKPTPSPTSTLRSQRSMAEVPPLRRTLPPEGPKPVKPKRPPTVNLDCYRKAAPPPPLPGRPSLGKKTGAVNLPIPGSASPSGPPRPPFKPSSLSQQQSVIVKDDDQDTYDDVDILPPPPPPPPSKSAFKEDFFNNCGSTPGDEESDTGEIYEPVDEPEEPVSHDRNLQKEVKRQRDLEKKEQKEKQKKENEYKKKFKLTEKVEVLHIARIQHDWQGGKNDLSVRQGDRVEIIRVKNNPEGRWLARTMTGTYGYISNTCVEVDYEEVKRRILGKPADSLFPLPPPQIDKLSGDDVYYDVGSSDQLDSINAGDDVYDDVEALSDDFPPPPIEISLDPKKSKKQEKEEKEFRKKFKFEGPIHVLCNMMVDPNTSIKKGGGKDLPLIPGEILEVIQFANDKKALCRNGMGKYGYVPRVFLLHEEGDIYDDIDNDTEVYDNDSNTT